MDYTYYIGLECRFYQTEGKELTTIFCIKKPKTYILMTQSKTEITEKNSDITMKCPQTGKLFHPVKIGQIFFNKQEGTTFRNRLNMSKDEQYVARQKAKITNIKAIIAFIVQKKPFAKRGFLEEHGFNWDAAHSVSTFDDKEWFEVFGYHIEKGKLFHKIYPPGKKPKHLSLRLFLLIYLFNFILSTLIIYSIPLVIFLLKP